ncbi:BREX-1 system adenine-specific DNA-methyltransferase PglX [Sporomusa sphaeroides DSM 2875]|uniref:BREX-1 system adenine-specific DNA-methyltransferase PglX n=1 Tax=Sporomusa sphaeroides TaxID=47679 RepID=UPI00202EB771|nr:BREX-1 system adenine-specific DNA-methyltransferase PglX [Sporomusa sphaeroides]MCM0758598.1 BREX-1 system adenine-specific DNA-methyltransferase PglX [Sporomusa sphaeroides DSM 2875]
MNKAAIKNFASEARKKLIALVKDKAGRIGITQDRITDPISKGEGYAIFPTHIDIEAKLTGKEVKQRENLVKRIKSKENGYELVMEEVAYTWFNRLIAIRFMEVNDYLPARVRILSSETAGKFEPDIVTQAPDVDLGLSQAEIEEVLTLKEKNAMDELFRMLFIKQCNELGKILPELFENTSKENNDYTEILLDISYTNEDGVIRDLLKIDEADFLEAVEIIGWLYQYYNTEPKDETFALLKKNVKITKERIPAATQLFTPDWIVRYMVENSLGRLWLEGHPDSDIKDNWKYYLEEAEQEEAVKAELDKLREERKKLRPEDIKVIDPCMGSGHILVYAFDVLMDIYKACGYAERDAAKLILQHNLYGLDIDDRAYQLSYFAVMMKARAYSRRILSEGIRPHLCAIQESNGIPKQEVMDIFARLAEGPLWSDKLRDDVEYLIDVFRDAKEYGSVLEVKQIGFSAVEESIKVIQENKTVLNVFEAPYKGMILDQIPVLLEQGKLLSQKYDVVVTNPPYMGGGGMSEKLAKYVKSQFAKSKSDLFAVFIDRCLDLAINTGYISMITMQSWMFLSSFEKLRELIITEKEVISLIQIGYNSFPELNSKVAQAVAFSLCNATIQDYKGTYLDLTNKYPQAFDKQKAFYIEADKGRYTVNSNKFSRIPGMPIAYWLNDKIYKIYDSGLLFGDIAFPKVGMQTSNNDKYLRLWYEVKYNEFLESDQKKWIKYLKGGAYRKWYGNLEYVLFYNGSPNFILQQKNARVLDEEYLQKNKCTWTDLTTGNNSFRYAPMDTFYDISGHCFFPNNNNQFWLLGYANTKVFSQLLKIFNSTFHCQVGDVARIAVPEIKNEIKEKISDISKSNVLISKSEWDCYETSWDFSRHPLILPKDEYNKIKDCFNKWKGITEERFKQLKANEEELNRIFINVYDLQDELEHEVDEKDVTIRKADLQRDIRSFISYALGCMLGRYSLDVEGLAYAGGVWDASKYTTFIPDTDNILPITDDEYFTDDIVTRFVEFVKVAYSSETLEENLDFIAQALGNKGTTSREIIRNYFLKDFYADHVKIYQKRPIYWLFDSGKENGFKALIYMHRYDQDTVGRVRADYLHKAQAFIENAIANCEVVRESNAPANEKAKAVKQKEKLVKQLAKTRLYDQAIAHIAHQRIAIDLDDGVVVNYAKFQGVEVANEGKKAVKIDLLVKI